MQACHISDFGDRLIRGRSGRISAAVLFRFDNFVLKWKTRQNAIAVTDGFAFEVIIEIAINEWIIRTRTDSEPIAKHVECGGIACALLDRHHLGEELQVVHQMSGQPGQTKQSRDHNQHLDGPLLVSVQRLLFIVGCVSDALSLPNGAHNQCIEESGRQ